MQSFGPNESSRFGLGHFRNVRLGRLRSLRLWCGFDGRERLCVYEVTDFLAQLSEIARDAPRNLLAISG